MSNITDLLDANEALLEAGKIRIVAPLFRDYGGRLVALCCQFEK